MERSNNNTGPLRSRFFICFSCLFLALTICLEIASPASARRSRRLTAKQSNVKKKISPNSETTPSTTKEYFQDINNLGRAYALYDRGLNEYIVGDFGLASEHLSSAQQIFSATYGNNLPQQETFYYDLALAQEGTGNLEAAIESYKKSLSARVGFFDGYLALAQLYGRMGKWQEGQETVRRALDLRPDDPRANLICGLILEKQGQVEEAQKFKTKARDFVSTYGLAGIKSSADKEAKVEQLNDVEGRLDNLPGEGPKDLELP